MNGGVIGWWAVDSQHASKINFFIKKCQKKKKKEAADMTMQTSTWRMGLPWVSNCLVCVYGQRWRWGGNVWQPAILGLGGGGGGGESARGARWLLTTVSHCKASGGPGILGLAFQRRFSDAGGHAASSCVGQGRASELECSRPGLKLAQGRNKEASKASSASTGVLAAIVCGQQRLWGIHWPGTDELSTMIGYLHEMQGE